MSPTDPITEKSKVSLPLQIFISVIVSLSIGVVVIYGSYSGLAGTDKDLKKEVDAKVDKAEYQKHVYIDSVRWEYFQKDIKKDLLQIKDKLNIRSND